MKTSTKMTLAATLGMAATFSSYSARAMPSYITNTQSWSQGLQNVNLGDATSHFCYLTGVTGHFVGGGEWVRVWPGSTNAGDQTGGNVAPQTTWWLGGGSEQQGVGGSANCLPYSTFKPEAGTGSVDNWTGWLSVNSGPDLEYGNPSCGSILFFSLGNDCAIPAYQQINAWQGDAAVTISGMTGQFDGGGEWIEADQATSPFAFNTFTAHAQSYNGIGGWVQGLFVGIPLSGFNPSFYGPNAGPATAAKAGVYTTSAGTGAFGLTKSTINMAPTNKAVCYLSGISGAFAGGGESVQIGTTETDAGEFWTLTVTSLQQQGTAAEARCYALDQSKSL